MTITCTIRTEKTASVKARPFDLCVGDDGKHQQKLGLSYSEACALRKNLSAVIAVYEDVRRAELIAPLGKNSDPKMLNKSNEGDFAVLRLDDGVAVSCRITDVTPRMARFEWKTGPGPEDVRWCWVRRVEWLDRVTLFPAGSKFLAV